MSREIKEIGYYPPTSVSKDSELFSPFSNANIALGEFPNTIPLLCLTLNKKANKTNFLHTVNPDFGLIVNEKVKSMLSKFKLEEHRFYKVNIEQNNKLLDYYWFHFFDDLFKYVDFSKTTIDIFHKFNFNVLDSVFLKSEDNLKNIRSTLGFEREVRLKELYFNDLFPEYDIMVNNIIGYGNLISEKLLNSLHENNITGYEVNPYTIIKSGNG